MAAGAVTAVEGASAAAMTGAGIAAMMNPITLAILAIDLTMRMFIDKKIPGTLGKILDFIPVIGPLLGAMFGLGPKRLAATNIQAQMSPGGEFGAQQNLTFIQKGGWFRGNRQTNDITELLASDFKKGLEVSFIAIRESMKSYVSALGLPAEAIANVSPSISVAIGEDQKKNNDAFAAAFKLVADQYADAATKSLNIDLGRVSGLLGSVASPTGEGLTKAQATSALASVQEVNGVIENLLSIFDDSKIMTFADQSNAVVQMMNLLGDAGNFLKQFQQEGESSSTTFTRLMTGFAQVDSALKLVGKSFETIGAESFKARQALLGLFGGAEGLSKAISAFRDNFYTAGERLAIDGKLVIDYMSSIGESAIRTTDQFRALADSVMTSADPVKQKLFADLMLIQGSFAGLAKVTGEVSSSSLAAAVSMSEMNDAIAATAELTQQEAFYADNFLTSQERLAPVQRDVLEQMAAMGLAAFTTKDDFAALVDSLDRTGIAGDSTYRKLMTLAPAFATVADAATAAIEIAQAEADAKIEAAQAAATAAIEVAQADVETAKANLLTSYHTEKTLLEGVISKFTGFAAALLLLNSGLVSGADAAEGAYRAQVQLARAGNQTAISGLGGSQQAYLAAKLATAGTSIQYQRIVGSVMVTNTMLAATMLTEADAATQQLDALKTQVGLLVDINDSVMSVESAISGLSSAMSSLSSVTLSANATLSGVTDAANATLKSVKAGAGIAQTGMSTDETFVTSLYNQLLGRAPDAAGLAGWTAQLAAGASPTSIIAGFTGSQEYMGSHADGLDMVPFDGYVAQLHGGERVKTAAAARQEDAMSSEIRSMRVELNAALVAIALNTGDTAKRIRKFDGEGLPATRT